MNKCRGILLLCMLIVPGVCIGSFLTAQKFPTTFQDLSFTERMNVIKEGYEPYESEYDSNGVCVKNCAYHGITLTEAEKKQAIDTQEALANSLRYGQQNLSIDTRNVINAVGARCANRNPDIPAGQQSPWGEPVSGYPRISSSYGWRIHPITQKNTLHEGIDYAVEIGTSVYATANGLVTKVWYQPDGCGYGIKIQHVDATYAVYCHLDGDNIFVAEGDRVYSGCEIAKSGNSGQSTGPHLHYGLKNKYDSPIDVSEYTGRSGEAD